jgi:hypothetical protein
LYEKKKSITRLESCDNEKKVKLVGFDYRRAASHYGMLQRQQ